MQVTKEDVFQRAVAFLQQQGYQASFREHYSGRAMYGRNTMAIVTEAPEILLGSAITLAMVEIYSQENDNNEQGVQFFLEDEMQYFIPGSQDSMGQGYVYY